MLPQAEAFLDGRTGRDIEDRPLVGLRNYYLGDLEDNCYPVDDPRWSADPPLADGVRDPPSIKQQNQSTDA